MVKKLDFRKVKENFTLFVQSMGIFILVIGILIGGGLGAIFTLQQITNAITESYHYDMAIETKYTQVYDQSEITVIYDSVDMSITRIREVDEKIYFDATIDFTGIYQGEYALTDVIAGVLSDNGIYLTNIEETSDDDFLTQDTMFLFDMISTDDSSLTFDIELITITDYSFDISGTSVIGSVDVEVIFA